MNYLLWTIGGAALYFLVYALFSKTPKPDDYDGEDIAEYGIGSGILANDAFDKVPRHVG